MLLVTRILLNNRSWTIEVLCSSNEGVRIEQYFCARQFVQYVCTFNSLPENIENIIRVRYKYCHLDNL